MGFSVLQENQTQTARIVAGLSLDFDNCAEILLSLVEENDETFEENCKLYEIPTFTKEQEVKITNNDYQKTNLNIPRGERYNKEDEIQQFLSEVKPSKTGKNAFDDSEKVKAKSLLDTIKEFIGKEIQGQGRKKIFLFIGSIRQSKRLDAANAKKHTLLEQYLIKMSDTKKRGTISTHSIYEIPLKEFKETKKHLRRSILMFPLLDKIADVLNNTLGETLNCEFEFQKGSLADLHPKVNDITSPSDVKDLWSYIKDQLSTILNNFKWETQYGKGFDEGLEVNFSKQKELNRRISLLEMVIPCLHFYNASRLLNLKSAVNGAQKELYFKFIAGDDFSIRQFDAMPIKPTSKINFNLSSTYFSLE